MGCPQSDILAALGLTSADLAVDSAPQPLADNASPAAPTIADATSKTYTYLSSTGDRLGQVVYSGNGGPRLRRWNPATARW
ncbi:hypothetical protein, partial [Mycobacterium hubeiense]|uniref:hypothetical protein n=1 Tax=Mycobacterium hubeiense TaxID=1867256 RepID=UPI001E5CFFC5